MRIAIERIDAVIGPSRVVTDCLNAIEAREGDWARLRDQVREADIVACAEATQVILRMPSDDCSRLDDEQRDRIEASLDAIYRCWIVERGLDMVDPPRDLPEGTDMKTAVVDAAGISVAGVRAEADVRITAEKARVRAEMGAAGK